jgi:hypothetical protein
VPPGTIIGDIDKAAAARLKAQYAIEVGDLCASRDVKAARLGLAQIEMITQVPKILCTGILDRGPVTVNLNGGSCKNKRGNKKDG